MKLDPRPAFAVALFGLVSGCAGGGARVEAPPTGPSLDDRLDTVRDLPVMIGAPYTVGGRTYTPEDVAAYDEVGYASWYGGEMKGRSTANGEAYRAEGISASHKTLPLPSYVEVTALDTGKTILVRINDRGPFDHNRLIDLSEGAAQQLGIIGQGAVGVRVRKVNPIEQERAVLRTGRPAAHRLETPESLLRVLRSRLAAPPPSVSDSIIAVTDGEKIVPAQPSRRNGRFIVEGISDHVVSPTPQGVPVAAIEVVSKNRRGTSLCRSSGVLFFASARGRSSPAD